MPFKPIAKDLLFTKNDSKDIRLGELVKTLETKDISNSLVVMGYPDDEGIHNNGGRVGASLAPDIIRKYLYKMTPHLLHTPVELYDIGNLELTNLENNHKNAEERVTDILLKKNRIITLGGGHDYGYPDGAGFLNAHQDSNFKPLVINLDAHLDVRPMKDKITSGTPFYRLIEKYKNLFSFLEIGIQPQCNSQDHYDWLLDNGGKILTYDQLMMSGESFLKQLLSFLEPYILKKVPTFLSIDIDAFSSQYAPGASQSFATGFKPEDILALIDILNKRIDIKIMGIYEVSPALDIDDRTSKLAALLAHKFIYSF